jgi:alpha-mannosidase
MGCEITYQRVHTKAKVRNYVLGGRRSIVFHGDIPACGYAIYRTVIDQSALCCNDDMELDQEDPFIMENEFAKVVFDKKSGLLNSIVDKKNNYNSLTAPISYQIWIDERDTWGHEQGRRYGYTKEDMKLKSIEKVESGRIRECIRAIYEHGGSNLEQLFYLYQDEKEIVVENRLQWDKNWHEFKIGLPLGIEKPLTKAEGSYGTIYRTIEDKDEYYMHRFLDVTNDNMEGLAIANDGKYSFSMDDGTLLLTVARSAMYAQGDGRNWYCPLESYEYTDIGKIQFTYVIQPHGNELVVPELYRMANRVNGAYEYLADSCHAGSEKATSFSLATTDRAGVEIMTIKKAEDDQDLIVRVLETEGKDQQYTINILGTNYPLHIGHNEIQSLKINPEKHTIKEVNFLEYE